MAKQTIEESVKTEDSILIPVKPALDNYRIPFVTEPQSFMMYGENALQQYNAEVKRVEAELRQEVYGYKQELEEVREVKVNLCSISAIIFSLLTLAMLFVGKFLTIDAIPKLFVIIDGADGITYILSFIEKLSANLVIKEIILAAGIVITALFALISMFTGIFTLKKPTGIFMRICLFLSFTGAILLAMMLIVTGKEIAIGLYIVIGLTFVSTLIGFCSKSGKSKVK